MLNFRLRKHHPNQAGFPAKELWASGQPQINQHPRQCQMPGDVPTSQWRQKQKRPFANVLPGATASAGHMDGPALV